MSPSDDLPDPADQDDDGRAPKPRGPEIYDSNPVTQAANSIPEAAKEAAATYDTRAGQPLHDEEDDLSLG
jgi:hypothetical protein